MNSRAALYADKILSSWIVEPQLNFKKSFNKNNVDLLLGLSFQQNFGSGKALYGYGYNSDLVLEDIHSASNIRVQNTFNTQYKYNAGFARLNYNFNDRYIINFTTRRDGSSRFGGKNRFSNFGAIGAAGFFRRRRLSAIIYLS